MLYYRRKDSSESQKLKGPSGFPLYSSILRSVKFCRQITTQVKETNNTLEWNESACCTLYNLLSENLPVSSWVYVERYSPKTSGKVIERNSGYRTNWLGMQWLLQCYKTLACIICVDNANLMLSFPTSWKVLQVWVYDATKMWSVSRKHFRKAVV